MSHFLGKPPDKVFEVAFLSATIVVPLMAVSGVFAVSGAIPGILSCLACIALTILSQTGLMYVALWRLRKAFTK